MKKNVFLFLGGLTFSALFIGTLSNNNSIINEKDNNQTVAKKVVSAQSVTSNSESNTTDVTFTPGTDTGTTSISKSGIDITSSGTSFNDPDNYYLHSKNESWTFGINSSFSSKIYSIKAFELHGTAVTFSDSDFSVNNGTLTRETMYLKWAASDKTTTSVILTNVATLGGKYYKPNSITVTYYAKYNVSTSAGTGGTIVSGKSGGAVCEGDSITIEANPNTGYSFDGWYNGSTRVSTSKSYTFTPNSDISLTAKFTPNSYNITYKDGGGTSGSTFSGTHESGYPTTHKYGTATTLKSASKTGYTFGGWYKEAACATKIETLGATAYTDAITLYAKWTAKSYNITYKDQGGIEFSGTHDSGYPTTHTYGTATNLKGATKSGYTFGGWHTDSACTTKIETLGATAYTDVITLYAKWTTTDYSITYHNVEGATHSNPESYTIESETITLTDATKSGYTFGGWFSDSEFHTEIKTIEKGSTGDKDIYAKFTANTYNITYKDQGGENFSGTHDDEHPTTHTYGTATTLKGATKSGYTFGGWHKLADCSDNAITVVAADDYVGDFTLYAKWNINSYTITWKNWDGTTLKTDNVEYGKLPSYTGEIPTKPSTAEHSYAFSGWSPAITTVTDDATYIAQFNETVNKYHVIYKNDDGTELQNTEVEYGLKIPQYSGAIPTKAPKSKTIAYEFERWEQVSNDEEEIVTRDVVYQAVFKEIERLYEVKFEMNGHGSQVQTLKVKYDGTIEEPTAPTADGMKFEGWYKDANYTTKWDFATDKVEDNLTLYAKWDKNSSAAKIGIIVGSSIGGAGLIGGASYLIIRKRRKIKLGK